MSGGARFWRALGSLELGLVCLLLLMLLTFFGTLEQKWAGLYLTSKKYFDPEAFFLFPELVTGGEQVWRVPLPLPGTYWVSLVLFLNLSVGGVLRLRKKASKVGILIAHFGILFLLLAGFVSSLTKEEGVMMVYEGERSDYAQSYHEPTVEVFSYEGGERGPAWVIGPEGLQDLTPQDVLRAELPEMPFSLVLRGYQPASVLLEEGAQTSRGAVEPVIDGFFLRAQKRGPEEEANLPGVYAEVLDEGGGVVQRLVLWAGNRSPVSFQVGGQRYGALLARKIWPMPFEVELKKSVGSYWPGTRKARWFQSDITKVTEAGGRQDHSIIMNHPMRHGGYTLYQARWDKPKDRAFSGFAIVRNPADQWPKYALYVVSLGLAWHFGAMLVQYLWSFGKRGKEAAK